MAEPVQSVSKFFFFFFKRDRITNKTTWKTTWTNRNRLRVLHLGMRGSGWLLLVALIPSEPHPKVCDEGHNGTTSMGFTAA